MPRNKRRGRRQGDGGDYAEQVYTQKADRLRTEGTRGSSAFEEWLAGALDRAVGRVSPRIGPRRRGSSDRVADELQDAPWIERRLGTVEDNVETLRRQLVDAVGRFESRQSLQISETVTQQLEVRITERVMNRVMTEVGTGMRALWQDMEQLKATTTQELTIHQQTRQIIEQRVETQQVAVSRVTSSLDQMNGRITWLTGELATCQRRLTALGAPVVEADVSQVAGTRALEGQAQEVQPAQRDQAVRMEPTREPGASSAQKRTGSGTRRRSTRATTSAT